MTPLSEAQAALAEARKTTLGFEKARAANPNAWLNTHNSKTEQYLVKRVNELGGSAKITPKPAAPKPPPSPTPPPPVSSSIFAGKGLFTTSDAGSASGLHSDWVAVQKDPEGAKAPIYNNNPGRLCWWQARPTQDIIDLAIERGLPYIGQAENKNELARCLALNTTGLVAKALVGNAGSWGDAGKAAALQQRWDLIQEWYWNAHPWEQAPDAANYPRFVNVCIGIYSEGELGGDGYVPQSKTVADYRAVWKGGFSPWKAEAMTEADRAAYNA